MNLKALLNERVAAALAACGAPGDGLVQTAARPEFGDYQANGVMAAAKRAGANPRELAGRVIEALDLGDIASSLDIAGPGFINITLAPDFLTRQLANGVGVARAETRERVVVDYSAPNLAKEMHVGHLRSTIIGDAMVRMLEALGHEVIRQNHVGDWGTQFGMLLTYMKDENASAEALADLETFYRQAKLRFDEDADFADRARATVVALQAGEGWARAAWQQFIDVSMSHCQSVYEALNVTLSPDDVMPESAYNDALAGVVERLDGAGLLSESDGAQCVFLDEFKGKDGSPLPVIVQKSDGGYLYATTDLAAIDHRSHALTAQRVLYLVDVRQSLHFRQVFAVARAAGFASADIRLEHLAFGAMLGTDGKPFKTREGGVVKLADLLAEARERARAIVDEKNPDLSDAEKVAISQAIGIGAVKYADLSKNRTSDYVFDWEQMLSFDGNTAPYLQYACARIRSIFRKADQASEVSGAVTAPVEEPERLLVLSLCRMQEVVEQAAEDGFPHYLCAYLYEVATRSSQFYEQCNILNAEGDARERRLNYCAQTLATLTLGLSLLGIEAPERM